MSFENLSPVKYFAPISIGNVSVGFDTLGLAVAPADGTLLGDIVEVEPESGQQNQLLVKGKFANRLPTNAEENIVWYCLSLFNQSLSKKLNISVAEIKTVKVTLHKELPVGSGLGSSACSVVAALGALNEYYQQPFSKVELLHLMGDAESQISGSLHYDNVAPCFLGGLQLMLEDTKIISRTIPLFGDYYWVMAYPDVIISTKEARNILPENYDRATLIQFGQNLAGFIDACYRKDDEQAFNCLKDIVAEPYREALLPNFKQAREYLSSIGCNSVGISGSGPTLFAITKNKETAQQATDWLTENYLVNKDGFVHICKADIQGARKI